MSRSFSRLVLGGCALALLLTQVAAAQEAATIQGRVTSEAGAGLAGANIFVQALNLGTVTREDGSYVLPIPAARVSGQTVSLGVRRLGYLPQTAQVVLRGGSITQDFVLAVSVLRLDEVVITGAGTESTRERLGNVINSVSAEQISRSAEPNVVQALAGKAPNVIVNQQSGEPGASSYIRIRGAKTIQGTGQPLFVVDGVPIDNSSFATGPSTGSTVAPNRASDISPSDIESIDILKGSAAAAIYGARAAQGVVLITTKSGKAGETRYSLRSTVSLDQVSQSVPLQTRFGQGSGGVAATCTVVNCTPSSASFGAELAPGTRTYDHFDEVFDDGSSWENVLSASGGTDRTTFYLSLGNLTQDGMIVGPNSFYNRTTARLKASHRLVERFTVGANIAYTDVRGAGVQKGSNTSGLMLGALRTPPEFNQFPYLDPETGLHRSYRFPNPAPGNTRDSRRYDNPLFVAYEHKSTMELGRVIGNINLDYVPTEWLNFTYTLGGDYFADYRLEALPLSSSAFAQGQVLRADIINYQLDHNLVGTANHTFSENFAGTLTVGQNLNSRRYRQNYITGLELIAPRPFAIQNTVTQQPSEFRSLVNTESYFAQATADIYDQLFLTGALRYDGFSTFGESERRHLFPKISAAWTFSKTLGLEEGLGPLSFGKMRLAYGETGTEPGVYQTITALNPGREFGIGGFGDYLSYTQGGIGGLVSGTAQGNSNLKPERTKETEVGLDFGFFEERADLSVTYYDSRSVDVILDQPLAPSTGFLSRLANAAEIENKGWEAALNLRPFSWDNVEWEVGLQWAKNDNRVIDLEGAEFVDKSAGTFFGAVGTVTRGSEVGVLRGQDFVRCGRGLTVDDIAIDETAGHCQGAPRGALYIADDGFPIDDATDRVIANPNPDWTGSLRSSVTVRGNLQFSGLIDVKRGGDVWNGTKGALYNFGTHKDTELRGQDVVFGDNYMPARPGKSGAVAGPGAGTEVTIDQSWYQGLGSGFGPVSQQFIEDGSYVKLRELAVSYSLANPFIRNRLGFSTIDFRLAGRNLATWTDYTGIDPETNLGGAEVFVQGIDYFNNPQTRSFVFSLGLNR